YIGGAIIAANKMADIGEKMAANNEDLVTQNTLYSIDQTYWTTVSLRQKEKLAYSYRDLVKKLDDDVKKMIAQGVATKADGLRVDVKVNEAEMQIVQVEDGLVLAKMLLCQLCGLPLEEDIMLADENKNTLDTDAYGVLAPQDSTYDERPEVRLFQNAVEMSEQNTKLVLAQYLPHVLLTGGYMISNPNLWDGFNRRFSGVWNVGVTLTVPVWNWMESKYKIRGSKATTTISRLNLADLEEKIHLQATQARFKIKEAYKRLNMAKSNLNSADENLRCANVGFKEGVMDVTDVMAAQTAWQKAQSDKIDAEVDVKLSQVELQKALGRLR
ncbi:MAG: TolC family protein, partial [Prevotella sp.]